MNTQTNAKAAAKNAGKPNQSVAKAAAREQKKVPQGGKVGGKDVKVRGAILPVVSSKTKEVFLRLIPKDAESQIETISKTIADGKVAGLGNELKDFVRNHDKVTVWSSKAATVDAAKLGKSAQNQIDFWNKSGFTVTNAEQMVKDMEAMAEKATRKAAAKRTTKTTEPA